MGDLGHDDDEGNDDETYENDGSRESTGRWTREEHHTFIRGLEMYGKGWKKIASLIKTRTVVQIRTHAQKYFLKLAKARQNGDASLAGEGKSSETGAKKKKKRRSTDRPLSVALPLQPFVQSNGTDPLDVDDGLYNFLSPPLLPTSSGSMEQFQNLLKYGGGAGGGGGSTAAGGGGGVTGGASFSGHGPSLNASTGGGLSSNYDSSSSINIDMSNHTVRSMNNNLGYGPAPLFVAPEKPSWFQKGHNVGDLLKEAEGLDWMLDAGDVHIPGNNEHMSATQRSRVSSLGGGETRGGGGVGGSFVSSNHGHIQAKQRSLSCVMSAVPTSSFPSLSSLHEMTSSSRPRDSASAAGSQLDLFQGNTSTFGSASSPLGHWARSDLPFVFPNPVFALGELPVHMPSVGPYDSTRSGKSMQSLTTETHLPSYSIHADKQISLFAHSHFGVMSLLLTLTSLVSYLSNPTLVHPDPILSLHPSRRIFQSQESTTLPLLVTWEVLWEEVWVVAICCDEFILMEYFIVPHTETTTTTIIIIIIIIIK